MPVFRLISLDSFGNTESDLLLGLTLFMDPYKYVCYVALFVLNLTQINLQSVGIQ